MGKCENCAWLQKAKLYEGELICGWMPSESLPANITLNLEDEYQRWIPKLMLEKGDYRDEFMRDCQAWKLIST